MKLVTISFQKSISDDVQIIVNGKPLDGLMVSGGHLEYVETQDGTITVEVDAINSLKARDKISNVRHGDNFTYNITRDDDRKLNLERKYGFDTSN